MMVLLAKNIVKAGHEAEFIALAQEMVRRTRQEAGCISYELVRDREDGRIFYFMEKYTDEAALAAHRAAAYFQEIVPQLGALRVQPSEVHICEGVE